MADALRRHAVRTPGRRALICGAEELTHAELDERATRMATRFVRAGVRPGEIVAIALPNSVEFFVATFAAWKVGASPLPLSSKLPPAEWSALLDLARPGLVVGLSQDEAGAWPVLSDDDPGGIEHDPLPAADGRQPWKVIGSGGSTGRPKLVVAGRPAVVDPEVTRYTIEPGDRVLIPGPLYHQGPFIFSTAGLLLGNLVVVMTKFDAAETLALVEKHRITWVCFVPTMMHRIWRLPEAERRVHDLSSLRLVGSTGAPWAWWLKEQWIRWLGPERILEMYGGTEEQGGLFITGRESLEHPGALGRAGPDVRVVTPDGADAPVGETGELVFRRRAEGNHSYLGEAGGDDTTWTGYGDVAHIGPDGYIYLADRRTDMIVSGGANVYPAEVEGALESHPQIRSAAVIGLPDDDLGQRVHAIVEASTTDPVELATTLRAYLRERLAGYKIPKTFECVDQPLRDDTGKVRRLALRDARMRQTTP